jgi:hypothetical protein
MRTAAGEDQAGPLALGLRQLREDPQYRRIAPRRRGLLVQAALEDGRGMAQRIRQRFGCHPAAIAAQCCVAVVRSRDDAGYGSVIVYADYTARPPCVTLYVPAILRLDALIAQRAGVPGPGIDSTLPIFLAHELYHHFDATRAGPPLSRQHPVRIFRVGSWSWTSGLASLAEIAAGSFAQHLLGLSFHPKLLERYLLEANSPHGDER